jgi:hypothetical protein
MTDNKQPTLTTKQIAALAEIGEDRLAQIERTGFIKRVGRNCWPAAASRHTDRRGPVACRAERLTHDIGCHTTGL